MHEINAELGSSVIAFLDKNDNCCIIVCAFLFWKKIYIAYLLDMDHFLRVVGSTESEILDQWVQWYTEVLQSDITLAPKSKWKIASNAPILFKNKDTYQSSVMFHDIRVRIYIKASYKGKVLPFKPALQAANAAIFKSMTTIKHKGMSMKQCQHLVPDLQKKSAILNQIYGDETQFVIFQYDIENFFTNVSLQIVAKAMQFFITDNKEVASGFWVHKKNKKLVFVKEPDMVKNFMFISTSQLCLLIEFEMKNCFFLLGRKSVLKQIKGLSIGGHLSSALAIMLANYAEHMSLVFPSNNLLLSPNGSLLIDGIRITDDGLIITVIKKSQPVTIAVKMLEAFIRDFEINSGRSLNIVLADLSRIYHIFENTVVNTGCQIIVRFNVKNYVSVRETGSQKIKKGIYR